jgi:CRISPR-associated protein Cas1
MDISGSFNRNSPEVLALEGHAGLKVRDDALHVSARFCEHEISDVLQRAQGTHRIKRIIINGHSGNITVDALRWLSEVNQTERGPVVDPIALIVLNENGEPVTTSARPIRDAKLLRAQALVRDKPQGLEITKYLLRGKFAGHANSLDGWDACPWLTELDGKKSIEGCANVEGREARAYWDAMKGTSIQFDKPQKIPADWLSFKKRESDITPQVAEQRNVKAAKTKQHATNPINAMLNYGYGVMKGCARALCYQYGLEPCLGVHHSDSNYVDGLVLDLVEPVRPLNDKFVRDLLATQTFSRANFRTDERGIVELDDETPVYCGMPLTTVFSEQAATWWYEIDRHIKHVRRLMNATIEGVKRPDKHDKYESQTGSRKRTA